jgi:hypothetical protein
MILASAWAAKVEVVRGSQPAMRRILVRVAVLSFAMSVLAALVLHGCSGTQPARSVGHATTAQASASQSAQPEEDEPAFLGATKAAVPIKPRQKK